MSDMISLARVAHTNAEHVSRELERGDLAMAQGHAILLNQQAKELLAKITQALDRATAGSDKQMDADAAASL